MKKIAVIGGGASGLVAAIAAARTNHQAQITVYEKKMRLAGRFLRPAMGDAI
ncbi:MAG: NAD(P)-binding protein [Dorea sp.]